MASSPSPAPPAVRAGSPGSGRSPRPSRSPSPLALTIKPENHVAQVKEEPGVVPQAPHLQSLALARKAVQQALAAGDLNLHHPAGPDLAELCKLKKEPAPFRDSTKKFMQQEDITSDQNQPPEPAIKVEEEDNGGAAMPTPGGTLTFFKGTSCLLELTHRASSVGPGQKRGTWVVINAIRYPPSGNESHHSQAASSVKKTDVEGSNGHSEVAGFPSQAARFLAPWKDEPGSLPGRVKQEWRWRRKRPNPVRISQSPEERCFNFRPIVSVRSLRHRKKMAGCGRKPFVPVRVLSHLLRFENNESKSGLHRIRLKRALHNRLDQNIRLETCLKKIDPEKKKPIVQIQSWKTEAKPTKRNPLIAAALATKDVKSANNIPPYPKKSISLTKTEGKVTKVKSQLFQVTETCTAESLMSTGAPGSLGSPSNHGSPSRAGLQGRFSPHLSQKSHKAGGANSPDVRGKRSLEKSLPTPTIARIKGDSKALATPLASSSLISPDFQRVRMDIATAIPSIPSGAPFGSVGSAFGPGAPSSPRKRPSLDTPIGAAAKRHRLSTDSRGSGCSSDGSSNLCASPLTNVAKVKSAPTGASSPRPVGGIPSTPPPPASGSASPLLGFPATLRKGAFSPTVAYSRVSAPSTPPSNSFSIASIMGRDTPSSTSRAQQPELNSSYLNVNSPIAMDAENSATPKGHIGTPLAEPSSSHVKASLPSLSQPSAPIPSAATRSQSPPLVSITPYLNRTAGLGMGQLDPHLAHLAGVAAHPRLGLTPAGAGFAYPVSNAQALALASVLTHHSPLKNGKLNTLDLNSPAHIPASSSATSTTSQNIEEQAQGAQRNMQRQFVPVDTYQYRGEPKINVQARHQQEAEDAPLDLCVKRS